MSIGYGIGKICNSLFIFVKYDCRDTYRRVLARLLLEKAERCADNIRNTATTLSAFGYRATLVAFLCVSYMEI